MYTPERENNYTTKDNKQHISFERISNPLLKIQYYTNIDGSKIGQR